MVQSFTCLQALIIGNERSGPVDCTILFDFIDFVFSEAKKKELDTGVVQCLMQQRAGPEFLVNSFIDFELTGVPRTRKFEEIFDVWNSKHWGSTGFLALHSTTLQVILL